MERLTWEHKDGGNYVDTNEIVTDDLDIITIYTGNAINRLAEYEDTNLTPNEIEQLKSQLAEAMELLELASDDIKIINHCNLCEWYDDENNICISSNPCVVDNGFKWQHSDRYEKLKEKVKGE